jgi:hypothetical protein
LSAFITMQTGVFWFTSKIIFQLSVKMNSKITLMNPSG